MPYRIFCTLMIIILTLLAVQPSAYAYSYGDPGEEPFAKAYNSLQMHLEQDNWEEASKVIDSYEKEFELYFSATKPLIDQGFEIKDKELVLVNYQAAMRLNIERRLFFATEDFEDYGSAKLLLAKARGTFDVLMPIVNEKEGDQYVKSIYEAFDNALVSLGNPGLFGIGSKESDLTAFQTHTQYIIKQLKPLFPIATDENGDAFTEEDLFDFEEGEGNPTFWLWFTIILIFLFVLIIVVNRRRK
jgi:hypothetical protein